MPTPATRWLLVLVALASLCGLSSAFLPPLPSCSGCRGGRATRLAAYEDEDDDLTARSVSLLGQLAEGLNKELPVPTALVPPRASDADRASASRSTTTIKGWFPLSMGLALTIGNPVYPAAFIGFLYLSRPTDAPDFAAAVAAGFVAGVVNPLLVNFADATGLDDTFLARLPFFLGAAATFYVLASVLQEGREEFSDAPRRAEKERIPAVKQERDLKFFDVKMKNTAMGRDEDVEVEVKEKPPTRNSSSASGKDRWRE